jgi:hypothetical protein
MRERSIVNWRIVTLGAVATLVALAVEPGRAQGVRGQARAVQSTVSTSAGSSSVGLADTGTLTDASDARDASQGQGSIAGVFRGEALHAATIGSGDRVGSEASAAGVTVSVAGIDIGADFLMSRALATAGGVAGASNVEGLSIAGMPIAVTGEPNQTVAIPNGSVILNEQRISADGITVNALRVIVTGVADVVVASATAGVH